MGSRVRHGFLGVSRRRNWPRSQDSNKYLCSLASSCSEYDIPRPCRVSGEEGLPESNTAVSVSLW